MKNQKGISTFFAILVVGIVAIIGFAIVFSYQWIWTPEEGEVRLPEIETPKGAAEAYIKVISPNGREEWEIGKTYTVKWSSSGVEKLNIDIVDYRAPESCLINKEPISAKSGEYAFELRTCTTHQMGVDEEVLLSPGDKYKVLIESDSQPSEVRDFTDNYFSIVKKDETADWKVYRNEEYGFEIKYPSYAEVTSLNIPFRNILFSLSLPFSEGTNLYSKTFIIDVEQDSSKRCSSDYYVNRSFGAIGSIKPQILEFNKIEFIRIDDWFGGTETYDHRATYLTKKGGKCFILIGSLGSYRYAEERGLLIYNRKKEKEIFDKMLSTFRFIE